uniref:Activating transcription factor 1 n=1 Tax=Takifugu rubripes TaxID=31033 RepID=A0A674P6Y9_TAKRU
MSLGGSSVAVVQLPGGQFQVQGVIQSAQPSVIQSPHGHAAQVRPAAFLCQQLQLMRFNHPALCFKAAGSDSEDSQDSSDSGATTQKTREILARRPSYRKILNELSSEEVAHAEGKNNSPTSTGVTVPSTSIYQTSTGQYSKTVFNQPCAGGELQTYQIRTATASSSLPQTVVTNSPVGLSQLKLDDPTVKREIRLAKNREAARECRRKKKEYVKCLENRVAVLENQNKTLIEELKTLKDLYCVKTG